MDVSLERDPLLRALQLATPLLDTSSVLPILSYVLLETTELGLQLTATDTEVGLRISLPAEVREPGILTVPGRPFQELVRALAADPVTLTTPQPGTLRIQSGVTDIRLHGLPAEDFPAFELPQGGRDLPLDGARLQRMLAQTHFAMARDEVRGPLAGLLVSAAGDELRLVATDGHRLALVREALPSGPGAVSLVPRKAVEAMTRLLGPQAPVTLRLTPRQAALQAGPVRLVCRCLEGGFPNYEAILPREFPRRVVLDREALAAALRRVAVLAEPQTRGVRLTLREGALHLAAASEAGEAADSVPAEIAGEPLTISFNARYLLEALGPLEGEQAVLELGDARSPAALSSLTDTRYRCLIMPLAP